MVPTHTNNWCVRSTNMEWFLYTLITDVSAVQIWNGSYTLQSLMCQKHKYGMVPIHTNHWCVRSTTMEWFLYTSISDVSEAQVWNGSYTHKSLMCTIMEWFLYTTTLTCQKHNYGMVPIYTNHWCAQLCNGSYTHTPITAVRSTTRKTVSIWHHSRSIVGQQSTLLMT